MKLPKDVDDLMWQVAEDATPELMDEFAARFPQHKGELARRIQMVRQLKGSRPRSGGHPRFKPSSSPVQPAPALPSRWTLALVAGSLLAAGALAGIFLQRWLFPPDASRLVKNDPPRASSQSQLGQGDGSKPLGQNPSPQGTPSQGSPGGQPPSIPQGPFDLKITVDYDRASLSQVLDDIALKTGVRLVAAPGMPELEIEAKYYELPAITILNDLGRNFGFTPLKQTETEALLIPAVDPTRPQQPASGGYAAEIPERDGTDSDPGRPPGRTSETLPPALNGPINP